MSLTKYRKNRENRQGNRLNNWRKTRKKNLLVDGGRDCRASDSSFTSDAKHVMRGRERAMESARACVVFRE